MPTQHDNDDLPTFQSIQLQFAACVREPDVALPPAGVDARRMAVYRDLVFNNLDELLSRAFPILRRLTSATDWRQRVRRFLVEHRARTPYFADVGAEFVDWIVTGNGVTAKDPPFLAELAHFERQEIEVAIDTHLPIPADIDTHGDLLAGLPVLVPSARPLSYRFAVHRIDIDFQPDAAAEIPTCLIVHAGANGAVRIVEINAVTYRLLELLQTPSVVSGRDALQRVAGELGLDDNALMAQGRALLEDLRDRNIIVGSRAALR